MDSYTDYFLDLPLDEQDKLVGTLLPTSKWNLAIHLDEYSAKHLDTLYGVIQIGAEKFSRFTRERLYVYVPSNRCTTDGDMRAILPIDIEMDDLIEKITSWAARYSFRYINIHALEDYCKEVLDCVSTDWD